MATYSGRSGMVTVNSDATEATVLELGNWSLNASRAEIDTTAFSDGWGKSDVGMATYTGTMGGNFDPADTTGQVVLTAAFTAGTLLQDLRLYIAYSTTSSDTIRFIEPDLTSDANAGVRITGLNIGQDKNGVASFEATFSGSGPFIIDSATVV